VRQVAGRWLASWSLRWHSRAAMGPVVYADHRAVGRRSSAMQPCNVRRRDFSWLAAREACARAARDASDYMVKGADTYRLVTDHLGSVRLVVNTATLRARGACVRSAHTERRDRLVPRPPFL
jgi:hypothetical protein